MRRMAQQALQGAQARLDQLQRQYDEAFMAYEANPSNDLKKERYAELKLSLHKAEDVVNSLATAAGAAAASGWQICCPVYFPACILFCSFGLVSAVWSASRKEHTIFCTSAWQ